MERAEREIGTSQVGFIVLEEFIFARNVLFCRSDTQKSSN